MNLQQQFKVDGTKDMIWLMLNMPMDCGLELLVQVAKVPQLHTILSEVVIQNQVVPNSIDIQTSFDPDYYY